MKNLQALFPLIVDYLRYFQIIKFIEKDVRNPIMASLEDRISKASLEDRIAKPEQEEEPSKPAVDTVTASTSDTGKVESWADEMATPVQPNAAEDKSKLSEAQVDGSSEIQNGSSGTLEPTYDVEVKLSDVQADPNNPLYSTTSFEDEQLGL